MIVDWKKRKQGPIIIEREKKEKELEHLQGPLPIPISSKWLSMPWAWWCGAMRCNATPKEKERKAQAGREASHGMIWSDGWDWTGGSDLTARDRPYVRVFLPPPRLASPLGHLITAFPSRFPTNWKRENPSLSLICICICCSAAYASIRFGTDRASYATRMRCSHELGTVQQLSTALSVMCPRSLSLLAFLLWIWLARPQFLFNLKESL